MRRTAVANMEIRSKLYIEIAGEPVFGRGRSYLFEAIDTCYSINQTAKGINISYRMTWFCIWVMEGRLNMKFLERQVGGGGATLTEDARKSPKN
jgi:molybdate transport system regulatory protein